MVYLTASKPAGQACQANAGGISTHPGNWRCHGFRVKIHPGKLVLDRPGCVSVLALAFVSVLALHFRIRFIVCFEYGSD